MVRDLGNKYTCFKCDSKFYDLKRPIPVCPKCGTDQREVPLQVKERKKARPEPVEEDLEDEELEDEDEDD